MSKYRKHLALSPFQRHIKSLDAEEEKIYVRKIHVDMVGDLVAGIMLSQIIYWYMPTKKGESALRVERGGVVWLAKKDKDWWEEIRLTPDQIRRARKILTDKGLIRCENFKFGGIPQVHYAVNEVQYVKSYDQLLESSDLGSDPNPPGVEPESDLGHSPSPLGSQPNSLYTKNTTKITTESTGLPISSEAHPENVPEGLSEKTTSRRVGDLLALPPEGAKRESEAARERRDQVKELWEVFRDTFIAEIGDFIGTRKGVREDKSIKTILDDIGDFQKTKDYLIWFVKNWKDAPFLKRDAHPSIGAASYFRKELLPVFLSGGKFGQKKTGPITSATADLTDMWDKFNSDYSDKLNKKIKE